jgi:hypothetical protein
MLVVLGILGTDFEWSVDVEQAKSIDLKNSRDAPNNDLRQVAIDENELLLPFGA